jgi:autotransporter-associated beta strand protein
MSSDSRLRRSISVRERGLALALAALLLAVAAPQARGEVFWSASSGDWSVASNWGGAGPGPADDAYIINGGTASVTNLDGNAVCQNLWLGDPNSALSGAIQMSGGNLSPLSNEYIGNLGPGTMNQIGGANSPNILNLGNNAGSSGNYTLGGSGALNATDVYLGNSGMGTFNQTGGTSTIAGSLYLGYAAGGAGNYNLSAGMLSTINEQVGSPGTGTFIQSGGTHAVASSLAVAAGGTFSLTGGVLELPGIQANGGAFNFSGGTLATGAGFATGQNILLSGSGGAINTSGNAPAFSGVLSGAAGLSLFGGGLLTLSGSDTYSGGTTLSGNGTTILLNSAWALPNSTLTLGASTGLAFNTAYGTIFTFYLGGLSGDGSGSLTDSYDNSLTLLVGGNGTNTTYSGALSDAALAGGIGSLTKAGSGTLVLCGSNTYSGLTSVNGGSLKLDFSQAGAPTSGIVNNLAIASSLALGGGTLALQGKASTINSQQFASLSVNPGASAIVLTAGTSGQLLLNTGSISGLPGGTVDFTPPGGTQSAANGINTSNANTNGILGGFATSGGTTWATVNASGDIVPYTSFTTGNLNTAGANGSLNVSLSGSQTTITSAKSCNSLVLTGGLGVSMSGAGSLALTSGGLIGNSNGGAITGGTLEGSSAASGNAELIVFTPQTLTISSVIADNGGPSMLTKAGPGTLVLTGSNTYSGGTTIGAGALQVASLAAAGALGTVTDNGGLVFGLSSPTTFAGAIGGVGSLTQDNASLLTLTGSSTYAGGTVVSVGTLQVGNGGSGASIGGSSSVLDNGSLVFNHNDSTQFAGVISGGGSLTQTGMGLLILTASNTYSGSTTISAGTLQLGNGTPSGSLSSSTLTDNGVLVFNRSDSPTYSGAINGSGSLVQAGAGVLTLLGSNTYTGGTTISAGTLQVGNGAAAGALGTGPMNDSGALVFNLSGAATFAGAISGNGSLTQAGTGVLTLLGNSSFRGSVTISAGVLQVGNGGSGASIGGSISVLDNGSLVFNHTDSTALVGAVSGSGGLTQAGTGLLTLTGGNCYSGSTTISAGTLQVGSGGSGASIDGSSGVLDNGSLVFNHNDCTEFDGVISGSGTLTQTGTGILILTASNTYSGSTTVSAGTLQVGGSGSGEFLRSPSVSLSTTGAALVFHQSDSLTYSGVVSGSGNLTKAGPGILTLLGNSTYSGGTTISRGTLQVGNGGSNGSIGGSSSVLDNGSLVFNLNNSVSFSPVVSGSGGLTQAGAGVLTLLGNNIFSGGATISAGTIQVGNGGASGSLTGEVAVAGGGALVLDRSDNVSMNLSLNGPGTLVKTASDRLTLTGNSSGFAGPINVVQGELVLAAPASMTACTVNSGGTLQFSGASYTLGPYATVLAQPGGVVQFQNAVMDGGNLYGPGTYLLTGSAATTFDGVTNDTTLQQNGPATLTNVTNNGLITGGGGLLLNAGGYNMGNGTLMLSGTDNTSFWGGNDGGVMVIQSGSLLDNHDGNLTSWGGGVITINSGGTLNADSAGQGESLDLRESLLINNGRILGATDVGYGAAIGGSGSFGAVNVSDSGTLFLSGGSLQVASLAIAAGTISGNGILAAPVAIAATLTVMPSSGGTLTFAGDLSGSGELIEAGPGVLVLSGSNSYSGGTLVTGGKLDVTSPEGLPSGSSLIVGADSELIFAPSAGMPAGLAAASPTAGAAAVPEPGTLTMLFAALAVGGFFRVWWPFAPRRCSKLTGGYCTLDLKI